MLVYSANDMAYVLAEAGGGDIKRFAQQMNLAAQRLGMTGTYYVNPNGLFDPLQVSTARDLAVLVQALLKEFPEHAHYFSQAAVKIGKRNLTQSQQPVAPDEECRRHEDRLRLQFRLQPHRLGERRRPSPGGDHLRRAETASSAPIRPRRC